MEGYQEELKSVKTELKEVEQLLEELLNRQSRLQQRRAELESVLQNQKAQKRQESDKQWDNTDFSWSTELVSKLQSVFKMTELRPMQLQTMNATLSGRDCLLIMPTGGGKSLCFQLPALVSKGITVVVSPLVSLMEDQVMALQHFSIEAVMLNADADKSTVKYVQDAMTDPKATLKLVYVTPEKLAKSKRFMNRLEKMYEKGLFARLVIDEVHCCSQWGHDFRPDYKFLGIMKRQFPGVPLLGLTATATIKVLEDVKTILNIPDCLLLRSSFNRPNLYYQVLPKPSSQEEALNDMHDIINRNFRQQSGIVYCFSQKETAEVAEGLSKRGVRSMCYHASLPSKQRSHVHQLWTSNQIQVVVATVAFGMGIDKPDVRFVIHHSLSKSMENLYQESGRAGRDGSKSHCILYYRFADVARQSNMVFTERTGLDNLYGIVAYCIDVSGCRRSRIARHFGETWDSTDCAGMCDHCDPKIKRLCNKRDVTRLCQDVIKILNNAAATNQRVTAPKVLDAWYNKGAPTLRVKEVKVASVSRDKAERILAHMLLEGYIREDFHFTAYSTICYLLPGSRAKALLAGSAQVAMEFESKASATTSPTAETATTSVKNGKTKDVKTAASKESGVRVKPVFVNKEQSHFSSHVPKGSSTSLKDDASNTSSAKDHHGNGASTSTSGRKKAVVGRKRKPVISSGDDDSGEERLERKKRQGKVSRDKSAADDMKDLEELAFASSDEDSDFKEWTPKRQKRSNVPRQDGNAGKMKKKAGVEQRKLSNSLSDKGDNSLKLNCEEDPVCVSDSD
ncbi:ATP-dependent DNA helicase Q1-like [Littorina saxatilis]|uniref:ATP-dependent DNA helicase n=1 Tax=Littorina saxatilis TaxID=31220 RepID=A0AAN9B3R5_9CAEN